MKKTTNEKMILKKKRRNFSSLVFGIGFSTLALFLLILLAISGKEWTMGGVIIGFFVVVAIISFREYKNQNLKEK